MEQINFGVLTCDIYTDNKGVFFMTKEQIGRALKYADPQKAIDKLHQRHKERLDKYSIPVSLGGYIEIIKLQFIQKKEFTKFAAD